MEQDEHERTGPQVVVTRLVLLRRLDPQTKIALQRRLPSARARPYSPKDLAKSE